MTKLVERARIFATERHEGQVRKYTGEPYINHPKAVVDIVKTVPHTDSMIAAAWLHDTVEDTSATLNDILNTFGVEVCYLVEMLTDVSKPSDGNRSVRKSIDREHSAKSTPPAMTIKLADLINNSESIVERDPKFAETYIEEKMLLLDVLVDGDERLWQRASKIVVDYMLLKHD